MIVAYWIILFASLFVVGAYIILRFYSDFQIMKSLEVKTPFRRPRVWVQDDKLGGTYEVTRGVRGSGDKHSYMLKNYGWKEYHDWQLKYLDDPFQVIVGKGAPYLVARYSQDDSLGHLRQEVEKIKSERDHYKSLYETMRSDMQLQTENMLDQTRRLLEAAKKTSKDERQGM